jgi:hypothetical protein
LKDTLSRSSWCRSFVRSFVWVSFIICNCHSLKRDGRSPVPKWIHVQMCLISYLLRSFWSFSSAPVWSSLIRSAPIHLGLLNSVSVCSIPSRSVSVRSSPVQSGLVWSDSFRFHQWWHPYLDYCHNIFHQTAENISNNQVRVNIGYLLDEKKSTCFSEFHEFYEFHEFCEFYDLRLREMTSDEGLNAC